MSWRFVYCPNCSTHQEKIGGCTEVMFCAECCTEWLEGDFLKEKKKKKKKRRAA